MTIFTRACATAALAAMALVAPVSGYQTTPPPDQESRAGQSSSQDKRFWWKDAESQRELGLSKQQIDKIDGIWNASLPSIRAADKEMKGLEAELNRLIRENTADEKVVALQFDRVEALRSQINKARMLMLYRMHRVLSSEQNEKLTSLLERRRKERGRR